MTTLKEIQAAIQDFVTHGRPADDYILQPDKMDQQDRLQVYRSAFYLRLIDVLQNEYGRLANYLGQQAFGLLVRDYLEAYPSRFFSVHKVGKYLPQYLRESARFSPAVVELAVVERRMVDVMFAPSDHALSLEALSLLAPHDQLTLTLSLIAAHHIQACYWLDEHLAIGKEHANTTFHIMIWRKEARVVYQVLTDLEWQFFVCCQEGDDFVTCCDKLVRKFGDQAVLAGVSDCLRYWVSQGVLCCNDIDA